MTPSKVLLCKKTANLVEGWRISFYDNLNLKMEYKASNYTVSAVAQNHDGWIVSNPEFGGFAVFMNNEWVEERFEDLGFL